jgi:hypothetical protein
VGLLIPLAGLALLWLRKTRLAGLIAVIEAVLIFLIALADQALFFFSVSPPPAVTIGEFVLIFVGIGYILYGPKSMLKNEQILEYTIFFLISTPFMDKFYNN